jgi:hypothetical protein
VKVLVGLGVMEGVKDAVGVGMEMGGATLMVLEERKFSMMPSRTVVRCTYGQTLIRKGVINGWLKSTPMATRSLGPHGSSLGETPKFTLLAGSENVTEPPLAISRDE